MSKLLTKADYTACPLNSSFYLLSCLGLDDTPDQEHTIYVKDVEALTGRRWNYQQLPIPIEQPAEDARASAAQHLDQLFKFKTNKVKATKNLGGLF